MSIRYKLVGKKRIPFRRTKEGKEHLKKLLESGDISRRSRLKLERLHNGKQ